MRCAAQNQVVSGSLERCIVVPAVTEVCRPQSRHSCKRGRLFSPTTRRLPQPGHPKPSGQRCLNKQAAQLSSSGNDFWNSASDRALAISIRPRDRANPIAQHTTSRQTCVNGISLPKGTAKSSRNHAIEGECAAVQLRTPERLAQAASLPALAFPPAKVRLVQEPFRE